MVYPLGKEMKVLEKAGDPGFDPLVKLLLLLLLPGPRLVENRPRFRVQDQIGCRFRELR